MNPEAPTKDRAYDFAKQRILDGRYPGGELITEGDVADALGISRTPVREAFLRLEAEGLLRLYPKRGALVVPVSAGEIEAVLETRLVVERFAVEKVIAAGRATYKAVGDDMAARVRDQSALLKERAYDEFARTDRDFHESVVRAAGNPIIESWYDSLHDRQIRMSVPQSQDPDRARRILAEHRRIAAAVDAGDVAAAHRAVEEHLANARVFMH